MRGGGKTRRHSCTRFSIASRWGLPSMGPILTLKGPGPSCWQGVLASSFKTKGVWSDTGWWEEMGEHWRRKGDRACAVWKRSKREACSPWWYVYPLVVGWRMRKASQSPNLPAASRKILAVTRYCQALGQQPQQVVEGEDRGVAHVGGKRGWREIEP